MAIELYRELGIIGLWGRGNDRYSITLAETYLRTLQL